MCGIAGLFDTRGRRDVPSSLIERMNDVQRHRGPDDGAIHVEPGVGLGHRRLSIIDLSTGRQPLFNEDGSVAIVFNGEIYNYRELARELTDAGHEFSTRTDTEVIVHGWEQWGEGVVERLRGMFAFAIWDRNRRTLFLARDRIGIKPLYYALLPDGQLLFASELKGILAHPDMPREPLAESVEDYFAFGYIPEPRTIYRHAFKLPPGHTLRLRQGEPVGTPRQYWDLEFASGGETAALDELCGTMRERLAEAVESHLVADVPLGAFLSGGVDSSAVVATMAGLSDKPVETASIGFGEAAFDEAGYARQVAEHCGTNHRTRQVDPNDFELIERLAAIYDEPYADSSAMPTYRVSELAREGVKVALSGDGGDENFAGYRRYRWQLHEERVRNLLPLGLRRAVFGPLGRAYPKLDWAPRVLRGKSTFQALARDSAEAYFHSVSILREPERSGLFTDAFRGELGGYRAVEVMRRHAASGPDHPLSLVQYLDFKTYLPGDILTKVDRASMAHGLEVRVPILDHRFVEWAASLSPDLKLRSGEGKFLLKKALEPVLPHEILYRRKMGFGVPLAEWFRGPLRPQVREALLGDRLADTGWFDRDFLARLEHHHASGRRDHSALIWTLLMFERALRAGDAAPASERAPTAAAAAEG